MKLFKKHGSSVVIVLLMATIITGCLNINLIPIKAKPDALNEKVILMLDKAVAQDVEGMYELMYPGGIELNDFRSFVKKLTEKYLTTEDYTWEIKRYEHYRGINNKDDWEEGHYLIQSGGVSFYIRAKWFSDENGSGFSDFYAFDEESWKKFMQ